MAWPDCETRRLVRPLPTHRPCVGEAELKAVAEVFQTRWLGKGVVTEQFEDVLQVFLGVKHVVAVHSGTSALHVSLEALELAPGDEVLVPSLTFAGTVQAIVAADARPVFCDVHAATYNLDVEDALSRATDRTRVILPVHYGGLACDLHAVRAAAGARNLHVVQDAAHAFGSSFDWRRIGTGRGLTCFSFDPTKNITCGGGGAICTDDDVLAHRVIPLRNVGISAERSRPVGDARTDYQVVGRGYRYHMSDINAAVGLEQLERIDTFRTRKLRIVKKYDEAFADLDEVVLPHRDVRDTHPFSYVVRVLMGRRDDLMSHLRSRDVDCLVEFRPNHLQPAFESFRTQLPITERLAEEILTLPLFVEMTDEDVDLVIDSVRSFWCTR